MKCLRLLLVVLMSVVIPVNGFAATPASVCPMQAQDAAAPLNADEMMAMDATMSDCCPEMDNQSPSAKPCKPGQACSVGWLFFALPTSFHFSPSVGRIVLTHYDSPLFGGQSAAIWHPPRQS